MGLLDILSYICGIIIFPLDSEVLDSKFFHGMAIVSSFFFLAIVFFHHWIPQDLAQSSLKKKA